MTEFLNIGSAIIVVASLYFGYLHGFEWWVIGILLFGLGTWTYPAYSNQRKRLLEAQIKLLNAKAEYYGRDEA